VDFVAPRNTEEELVAGIFASLLNLPRIGALDNFFDLGGDSLRAVQMLSLICARTGIQLDLIASFEASTVEQLAQRLRALLLDPAGRPSDEPSLVRRAHRPNTAIVALEDSSRSKMRSPQ
jgi:acyl carrier protein